MRRSSTQLPCYEELLSILSTEDRRGISVDKKDKHYADFSAIVNLLKSFNLPTSFFADDIKFEDWKDVSLFKKTISIFDELSDAIYTNKEDQSKKELLDALYDYLSEQDSIEKADILFVFGAKSTFRIEKAIDLFNRGYAPKILISGHGPFYEGKVELPEADRLAQFTIENGIPEEAIIIENESITVPDNVKRSLNLLEKINISHKKIILVNSPFSQRRGWAHFQKMSPDGTEFIRINTDKVSPQFSKDGWYKDIDGIKVVLKEFFGLRVSELINTS